MGTPACGPQTKGPEAIVGVGRVVDRVDCGEEAEAGSGNIMLGSGEDIVVRRRLVFGTRGRKKLRTRPDVMVRCGRL